MKFTKLGIELTENFIIRWYSIFIVLGIVFALGLVLREVRKQHMNRDFFINLAFYVILFGILGARLYYVLFNLEYYLADPVEIIKIWHGGLAIHGGIFVGIIVVVLYCQRYNARLLKTLDIIVVGVILAQAIGRWGNFFNQEAYGFVTTREALLNLHIPEFIVNGMYIDGAYYQPTFLYESLWNLVGFIGMLIIRRLKNTKVGVITSIYLIWYGIGRFIIEWGRQDSLIFADLKVAQVVSIGMIIAGIVILVKQSKKSEQEELYNQLGEDKIIY